MTRIEQVKDGIAARLAIAEEIPDGTKIPTPEFAARFRLPYGTASAIGSLGKVNTLSGVIIMDAKCRDWLRGYKRPLRPLSECTTSGTGQTRNPGDGQEGASPALTVSGVRVTNGTITTEPAELSFSQEVEAISGILLDVAERVEALRVKASECDALKAKLRAIL